MEKEVQAGLEAWRQRRYSPSQRLELQLQELQLLLLLHPAGAPPHAFSDFAAELLGSRTFASPSR